VPPDDTSSVLPLDTTVLLTVCPLVTVVVVMGEIPQGECCAACCLGPLLRAYRYCELALAAGSGTHSEPVTSLFWVKDSSRTKGNEQKNAGEILKFFKNFS